MPAELVEILREAEVDGDSELARLCRDSAGLISLAAYAKRLALNDVARAVRLTGRLNDVRDSCDANTHAHVASARAYALALSNDFDGALAVLQKAKVEPRVADDPLALAMLDLTAVQPLARAGLLADAERAAMSARCGFEAHGHTLEAAMADINLGVVLRMRDEPARALTHFDLARPVLAADPARCGMIDSNRAEAYMDLDDFGRAACAFEQARRAFQESSDHHAAAVVEGNLANLCSRRGMIDQAIESFERARRGFAGSGARGDLARLRAEEAEALAQAGDYRASRRAFAEAVEILDEVGMRREAARARLWEAIVAGRLGDSAAEGLQRDAESRFVALDNPIGRAEVALLRAELAHNRGDASLAIALYQAALTQLQDRPLRVLQSSLLLAHALMRANRLPETREVIERIEADPLLHDAPLLRPAVAHLRGVFESASGDRAAALPALFNALTALEQTRGTLRIEQLRSTLVSANFELYHDAWTTALDEGGPRSRSAAFDALERLRARSLLDVLHSAGESRSSPIPEGESAAVEAEYRATLVELRSAYDRAGLAPERAIERARRAAPPSFATLEARVEELERRLLATRRLEPMLGQPLSLDEVSAGLSVEQAIVKYFIDREHVSAMVVGARGAVVYRKLAPRSEVARLSQQLRFVVECVVSRGDARQTPARLETRCLELRRALHELLFAPLAGMLVEVNRLGIVPAAELHGLPLHALACGAEFPRVASYLPSATIALRLAESRAESDGRTVHGLSVGLSDETAPHMEQEAIQTAGVWPSATLLVGADATRAAFVRHAQRASHIHLALHGAFTEQQPMAARLRFADGWLSAREIAGLRLPGSSVVLASCDVGQTTGDAGEERYGLIRALFVAGARRVVASLWPLHDAVARRMFERYYEVERQSVDAGSSAGAALSAATQRCRSEGVPWAFWAGVICVGAMP